MNVIAIILLGSLATWRVTSLLIYEAGPFDVFARLRDRLDISYDERSNCYTRWRLAEALCCFKCSSVWVALPVALILDWRVSWLYWLAISAGAIMIDRWVNPDA
jgi:hypothetical protein